MVQIPASEPARVEAARRAILRAASEVFRRKGFHGAGMRDIAAELGVAVGKLYYWFENKEALLAFCQEDCLSRLLDAAQRVTRADAGADVRLALLVEGHLRSLNEGTPGSLAHLEVESLSEPRRTGIQRLRDRYERVVRDLVAEGMASGVFRAVDPKLAALAILGALNWTVKWYRPGGRTSLGEIAAENARLLVGGLLAPGRGWTAADPVLAARILENDDDD